MTIRHEPIIVRQNFTISVSELWIAITEHKHMTQWFFKEIPEFEAVTGFKTSFPVYSGNRLFTHKWEIVEVKPEELIRYKWCYSEYEGTAYVTFSLIEKNQQILLKLTNEGLETFPQNVPEFKEKSCRAGWEYFIKGRLVNYLSE